MFAEYLHAAMSHAVYEQFEDGTYFGSIPGFRGVLANEATLEETQRELQEVLEEWILMGIADHDELPEVDGLRLVYRESGHVMPKIGPIKRREFMKRQGARVIIPKPHHGVISRELLLRILKEAGISREEWEAL